MSRSKDARSPLGWRRVLEGIAFAVLLVWGLFIAKDLWEDVASRVERDMAMTHLHEVAAACRRYADDHEGLYPPSLGALHPDYLAAPDRRFAVDEAGRKVELIYRPGLAVSSPSSEILLEYPFPVGSRRQFARVGGHVGEGPLHPDGT